MSEIEVSVFEPGRALPPKADAVAEAKSVVSRVSGRAAIAFAVGVLHLVALAALLRLTVMEPSIEREASYVPIIVRFLDDGSSVRSAPLAQIAEPTLEKLPIEIAMPQLAEIQVEPEAPESTAIQFGQFIPPRPEQPDAAGISQFERQASLKPGQMVRVILRVEVLPSGDTGTVAIDTASGVPSADTAAVEYARTLRWIPASFGGEPTKMKIRLPVVFTGAG
jgi:TonB family protein